MANYLNNNITKYSIRERKYFINKIPKYLKDFTNIFSSNSVGGYNYVINLKNNKELSFRLLYNYSKKIYNYYVNI